MSLLLSMSAALLCFFRLSSHRTQITTEINVSDGFDVFNGSAQKYRPRQADLEPKSKRRRQSL
jgi:hypothetical protein